MTHDKGTWLFSGSIIVRRHIHNIVFAITVSMIQYFLNYLLSSSLELAS